MDINYIIQLCDCAGNLKYKLGAAHVTNELRNFKNAQLEEYTFCVSIEKKYSSVPLQEITDWLISSQNAVGIRLRDRSGDHVYTPVRIENVRIDRIGNSDDIDLSDVESLFF